MLPTTPVVGKILLSIPLVAALVMYFVRGGPGIEYSDDYRWGAIIGMTVGVLIVLLLLMRVWMGPGMMDELRGYPIHYGGPLLIVAVAVVLIAKADGDPPAGMTRAQAGFVAGFENSCKARQGSESYCACTARAIVDRANLETVADVERLGRRMRRALRTGRPSDIPIVVRGSMIDCAKQVGAQA